MLGKKLIYHFVTSGHQYGPTLHYSEVGAWYGSLEFSKLTGDSALRDKLIARYNRLMPGGAEAARIPLAIM